MGDASTLEFEDDAEGLTEVLEEGICARVVCDDAFGQMAFTFHLIYILAEGVAFIIIGHFTCFGHTRSVVILVDAHKNEGGIGMLPVIFASDESWKVDESAVLGTTLLEEAERLEFGFREGDSWEILRESR